MKLRDIWPWSRKSASSLDIFREIYGSKLSKSGQAITWDTAIRVSTVLACARVKAEGLASVPLKVFQKTGDRRDVADGHGLHYLLDTQPNPWQTAYEYRETIGLHLALAGNHYSFINRLRGEIEELIPFEPGTVRPKRADDGEVTYEVTLKDGRVVVYPKETVWHIRGLGWDGWKGLDAVDLAREAIGLAISAEEQHSRMFKNGIQPAGVYSVEGKLDEAQYKQLRKAIVDNNTGANAGLPMIVDRGAKWLQQAMTGVDSQHIEVRRNQVTEICRSMGVLPAVIGHSDNTTTFASAEAFFEAHDRLTMLPLYMRVEKSANAYLLGKRAVQQGYYVKHVVSGLLRASAKDRAEYFSKALGSGGSQAWMAADEIRALEELNPMGGAAAVLPVVTNAPKPPPADPRPA